MAAVLVYVIERRFRPRPPGVFAAYIALYCIGRFFEELLRIDPAHHIAGLRLNAWVSLLGIAARRRSGTSSRSGEDRPARPAAEEGRRRPRRPARWPSRRASASDRPARFAPCRRRFATSSWTSTRSRARSTSS